MFVAYATGSRANSSANEGKNEASMSNEEPGCSYSENIWLRWMYLLVTGWDITLYAYFTVMLPRWPDNYLLEKVIYKCPDNEVQQQL